MERIDLDLKELILKNQNLIYSIASKFRGDIEDLFQVGCIGLIQASKNYKEDYQTKFTTYAYPYIFGEIYKYVLRNKNIKLSNDVVKLNIAINKAEEFLMQRFNRQPTDLEIASFLEIPANKIAETRNMLETISLDREEDDNNLYNLIGSESKNVDDFILLKDALQKLDKQERDLILKRYFCNMTQSEIAKQDGVNQVSVSRQESKVLTKLRSYM